MVFDAPDINSQLLARWHGSEDLKRAIKESFKYGECYQLLEKLGKGEVLIDDAVYQISEIIDRIHKKTH